MPQSESVTLPLDIVQRLAPMAQQAGVDLPGLLRYAPTIDITQPIKTLALEIGRMVARENIFLRGDQVVTIDEHTGETPRMTARRFPAWLEGFAAISAPGAKQKRPSLTVEDAAQVLETDIFRGCLRRLRAVHTMRLPVLRQGTEAVVGSQESGEGGAEPGPAGAPGRIEFLEKGYDAESGIYTCDLLPYEMDWDLEKATAFLNEHGEGYCWTWPEGASEEMRANIMNNRSWSVQVGAMLGIYTRGMFEPGTTRPIFVYLGNKPGTGKSTLVSMALIPVFGTSSTTTVPRDEDKMTAALETAARARKPYLFFDDVGGGVFNNALYQFVTSRSLSARKYGNNEEYFEELNVTQVFLTGNDIRFDGNLSRRALVVELFLDTEVRGRRFRRTINTTYLSKLEVRRSFLSALCALVRNYEAQRGLLSEEALKGLRPLESFEHWTETMSAMVQLAGYCDPLAEAELGGAGNEDEDEMKELLIKVASEAEKDCEFDRAQLVTKARELGLLESLVGSKDDGPLDSKANKSWGRRLQKYRGQRYRDEKGREFRFSHRRQKRGASYPLRFL